MRFLTRRTKKAYTINDETLQGGECPGCGRGPLKVVLTDALIWCVFCGWFEPGTVQRSVCAPCIQRKSCSLYSNEAISCRKLM